MSIVTKRVCDICGAEQGETNHWFFGFEDAEMVCIASENTGVPEPTRDLCGERCALEFVQGWLREQKEAPDDHNRS